MTLVQSSVSQCEKIAVAVSSGREPPATLPHRCASTELLIVCKSSFVDFAEILLVRFSLSEGVRFLETGLATSISLTFQEEFLIPRQRY